MRLARTLKLAIVSAGFLSVLIGSSVAGAAPPSPAPPAAAVTGPGTARFDVPSLGPGQTYSSSVQLPDGKTATIALKVIQTTADWGIVYTWLANCRTALLPITYDWFHVYEGMSGNGSTVTNVASPNEYWEAGYGYGLERLTTPSRYITGGRGNLVVGAEFGTGYGPLSIHNVYYWHLIVNANGNVNSGSFASVDCSIIG